MLTKKNTSEVAIHLNKEKYVISDFECVIVQQICNLSDNKTGYHQCTRAVWKFILPNPVH